MRKLILALTLAMTMSSSVLAAWPMWDQFKVQHPRVNPTLCSLHW